MTTDAPPPTRRAMRESATGALPVVGDRESATGAQPVVGDFEITVDPESQPILDAAQARDAADSSTPGIPTAPAEDVARAEESGPAIDPPQTSGPPPMEQPAPRAVERAGTELVATGTIGDGTLVVEQAVAPTGPIALAWVDERRLALTAEPDAPASPVLIGPDLLARAPRRSPWRAGVLVPALLLALVFAAYAATTLLWPLHAIAPQIAASSVQTTPAPAAAPAWPGQGSAAVSVAGVDGALASTADPSTIASITKVVTALVVLDRMPLAVGESGPEYRFTAADSASYWQYRANGESALDVPVGGVLTQYQLLEGMLIGSANNYADRLASTLWPSDAVFADAANSWLQAHGLSGITIADPTGIEAGNAAGPEALLALAARAMADPVIAEIVGRQSVVLPGAGSVENTNPLLADPGVVGIKTGSLDAFNLLAAKDVTVGETTVRIYGAVLGQPDPELRNDAMRALFAETESELQLRPSVEAGTVAGRVVTRWADPVDIVTTDDASVVLWNGGASAAESDFALGDAATAGDVVGELTVTGPLDRTEVALALDGDVEGPSPWWRLTHPLDLFGLN